MLNLKLYEPVRNLHQTFIDYKRSKILNMKISQFVFKLHAKILDLKSKIKFKST